MIEAGDIAEDHFSHFPVVFFEFRDSSFWWGQVKSSWFGFFVTCGCQGEEHGFVLSDLLKQGEVGHGSLADSLLIQPYHVVVMARLAVAEFLVARRVIPRMKDCDLFPKGSAL